MGPGAEVADRVVSSWGVVALGLEAPGRVGHGIAVVLLIFANRTS